MGSLTDILGGGDIMALIQQLLGGSSEGQQGQGQGGQGGQ